MGDSMKGTGNDKSPEVIRAFVWSAGSNPVRWTIRNGPPFGTKGKTPTFRKTLSLWI